MSLAVDSNLEFSSPGLENEDLLKIQNFLENQENQDVCFEDRKSKFPRNVVFFLVQISLLIATCTTGVRQDTTACQHQLSTCTTE